MGKSLSLVLIPIAIITLSASHQSQICVWDMECSFSFRCINQKCVSIHHQLHHRQLQAFQAAVVYRRKRERDRDALAEWDKMRSEEERQRRETADIRRFKDEEAYLKQPHVKEEANMQKGVRRCDCKPGEKIIGEHQPYGPGTTVQYKCKCRTRPIPNDDGCTKEISKYSDMLEVNAIPSPLAIAFADCGLPYHVIAVRNPTKTLTANETIQLQRLINGTTESKRSWCPIRNQNGAIWKRCESGQACVVQLDSSSDLYNGYCWNIPTSKPTGYPTNRRTYTCGAQKKKKIYGMKENQISFQCTETQKQISCIVTRSGTTRGQDVTYEEPYRTTPKNGQSIELIDPEDRMFTKKDTWTLSNCN
eukprot:166030_1